MFSAKERIIFWLGNKEQNNLICISLRFEFINFINSLVILMHFHGVLIQNDYAFPME